MLKKDLRVKFQKDKNLPRIKISSCLLPAKNGASENGPWCEIIVEDNGIGFDEKYCDRIFNVFQRLHGRNSYEGTGIGLSIYQKIVDRHGGEITAKSKPDCGAKFIVTLPILQSNGDASHE